MQNGRRVHKIDSRVEKCAIEFDARSDAAEKPDEIRQDHAEQGLGSRNKTDRKKNKSLLSETGKIKKIIAQKRYFFIYPLAEEATRDPNQIDYDFDKVVQRELELQGYGSAISENEANKNFDYLTNPGGKPLVEEEEVEVQEIPLIRE